MPEDEILGSTTRASIASCGDQNVRAASVMFSSLAPSTGTSRAGWRPKPHDGASQSPSSPTTRAQSQLRSWTLFGSALLLSSYIAGSTRFRARARGACKLGRVSGVQIPPLQRESATSPRSGSRPGGCSCYPHLHFRFVGRGNEFDGFSRSCACTPGLPTTTCIAASARAAAHNWKTKSAARASATIAA